MPELCAKDGYIHENVQTCVSTGPVILAFGLACVNDECEVRFH